MTNPYELLLSLYLKDLKNNTPLFRNQQNLYKKSFNIWIDDFFIKRNYNQGQLSNRLYRLISMFCDISSDESIFFNCENIIDSIKDNKKITEDSLWERGIIQEYLNGTQLEDFNFKEMYETTQAKKIYFGMKKFFDVCGHNPFSFTNEELSKEDKMKFLHDIL
jgi:hypothetical protein